MDKRLEKIVEIIKENPDGISAIDIKRKYDIEPKGLGILVGLKKICYKTLDGKLTYDMPSGDIEDYTPEIQKKAEILSTADGKYSITKRFPLYFPVDGNIE